MNNRLKSGVQRLDPAAVAFAAVPTLLYIPALYYSLTTPFSLVDDYVLWKYLHIFDGLHTLSDALGAKGYEVWGDVRYKPAWDIYIGATWKIFGPTPWLHHLARWAMNFGAVAAFAAALHLLSAAQRPQRGRRQRNAQPHHSTAAPGGAGLSLDILPQSAGRYAWSAGSPNRILSKHMRLDDGADAYAARQAAKLPRGAADIRRILHRLLRARMEQGNQPHRRTCGCCSHTTRCPMIAELRRQPGPRISAVRALKSVGIWRALGGLPLIAVFLHTLVIVYLIAPVEGYGRAPLTPALLISNAAWLAETLFQLKTSLIIAAGLALLSAALLLFVAVNIAKRALHR